MNPSIICFGELLIDFVPTVNGVSLAEAPAFKKAPGGAPANVAAALSKLGLPTAFMGKVGDDEFGKMLAGVLEEAGVNISAMRFDESARTALAFVTLKADGDREFMFFRHPSADMLLTPDELDTEMIAGADIFHYGSISLIAEPCRSAHLKALEVAADNRLFLSYDPNLRLPLWDSPADAKQGILSIWERADLIKLSEVELAFLAGENSDGAARSLWTDKLQIMLISEGADGARFYTKEAQGKVPSFPVQAIDTTGSGDAFVAGFLKQLVEDKSILSDPEKITNALRYANASGALTATGRGAIPSLPSHEQIKSLAG